MANINNTTQNEQLTGGQVRVNTITRLVILILALVNQIANMFGVYTNLSVNPELMDVVSMGIVIVAALWCYWKNNSWTENAKICDVIFDALQQSELTIDDIADILKKAIAAKNQQLEHK